VFIGSADNAHSLSALQSRGITHIVNMAHDIPNGFSGEHFQYFRAELRDSVDETRMRRMLPKIVAFIQAAVKQGGKVLIHCRFGLSRASTAYIAYLVGGAGWTLADACREVVQARPGVRPNKTFFEDLVYYEKSCGKPNTLKDSDWHRTFSRGKEAKFTHGRFSNSHINL